MQYLKLSLLFILFTQTIFSQENNKEASIQLKNSIQCTSIKDQAMSGTCWSFGSMSFLESEMIRNKIPVVDLSEMFIARHAYLYKIKEHLKQTGKNFFTSGGQFQDVARVIKEYGIVPESVYDGKVNGASNYDHGILDTLIVHYVKELLLKGVTVLNKEQEQYLNEVFDKYIGKLPGSFIYKGNSYTPKTFAKKVFQLNMDDYINITSYNHHKMYEPIVLEDKYNWSNSTYYNVPFTDFMTIVNSALQNNYSIVWDGDVTETGFDYFLGYAKMDKLIPNVESFRNKTFHDSTSRIDHIMHIVGIGKDENKNRWYYIKNSWGKSNLKSGFMYMDNDYFAIKTVAYVIHKNAIPKSVLLKLKLH